MQKCFSSWYNEVAHKIQCVHMPELGESFLPTKNLFHGYLLGKYSYFSIGIKKFSKKHSSGACAGTEMMDLVGMETPVPSSTHGPGEP